MKLPRHSRFRLWCIHRRAVRLGKIFTPSSFFVERRLGSRGSQLFGLRLTKAKWRSPEMASRLSQRKLKHILSTGARAVVTANAGCILQIAREARQQGHKLWVAHPVDLLDLSYRRQKPPV